MSDGAVIVRNKFLSFHAIDWVKAALLLILAGLIYYSYWVQPVERTMTCYQWLTTHWSHVSNYSHGPLIPLIAAITGLVEAKRVAEPRALSLRPKELSSWRSRSGFITSA